VARKYARGIWHALFQAFAPDLAQVEDLPGAVRRDLTSQFGLRLPTVVDQRISATGDTRKDLLALADDLQIETVLLRYRRRYSVCVSTQVGCGCGCAFCATAKMGFRRQLSPGEIIAQVLHFQRELDAQGESLSNVVIMGMGEPLLNHRNVLHAAATLADPRGPNIPPTRITLSTVGIVPGILHLAEIHQHLPIRLAVSLHAATDALRTTLIPMNTTYPLPALMDALQTYTDKTGRHVFVEWALIHGVNDSPQQARALVDLLRGLPSHVNLMLLNTTGNYSGNPSDTAAIQAFVDILKQNQVPHTMRQRRGLGIQAGCGQLYAAQSARSEGPRGCHSDLSTAEVQDAT
jgi:23S rRNA (adenine2503-C2)-methyltransferase